MELLKDDYEKLKFLYKDVLNLLKQDFIFQRSININSALGYIDSFYSEVLLNDNITPLCICNLPSDGILSLYGYQVCRTTNIFLYDFLKKLDLNPFIQYIYIDKNNDWHIVDANSANHLVVCIIDNGLKLFLDLYNRLYFYSNLKEVDICNDVNISKLKYAKSIKEIIDTLDKYKTLQDIGIKHIYSYKY